MPRRLRSNGVRRVDTGPGTRLFRVVAGMKIANPVDSLVRGQSDRLPGWGLGFGSTEGRILRVQLGAAVLATVLEGL